MPRFSKNLMSFPLQRFSIKTRKQPLASASHLASCVDHTEKSFPVFHSENTESSYVKLIRYWKPEYFQSSPSPEYTDWHQSTSTFWEEKDAAELFWKLSTCWVKVSCWSTTVPRYLKLSTTSTAWQLSSICVNLSFSVPPPRISYQFCFAYI